MFSRVIDYFRDEEDENPEFIKLTKNIIIFVILVNIAILLLVTGWLGMSSQNPSAIIALSITLIVEGISLFLLFRENILMAKITIPFALIIAVTVISLYTNGLKNMALVGMPIVLMISSILLKQRSIFLSIPAAIIAVIIIAIFDLNDKIPFVPTGLDDAIILPILIFGGARVTQLTVGRLHQSIIRARLSEKMYKDENAELLELRAQLEARVNQRTSELESANRSNLRRARQFEAIAQVNRAITSVQDLGTLLPRITQVISEQFNIYHTGIFLLDDSREYAVLRAANSKGGKKMLARGHKLQVGQTSIVGFVTGTGQPRIALDAGADAVFFDNPDLPNTHSEITLPLRYTGQVFGALDVQSDEPNAFSHDDIEVLTTLADLVAIAIKNALALESVKKALEESQNAFEKNIQESWKVMRPRSLGMGFQLISSNIVPLEKSLDGEHIQEAMKKGAPVLSSKKDPLPPLAIPIRLRGKTIGVMNLQTRNARELTKDDIDIAQAVTERLSLAIETATLLQATQHRADIERVTAEISSKINSSTHIETLLQTAAQELSKVLGGSDVLVQIEPNGENLSLA